MSQTCKPVHDWKMPEIGDIGLKCQSCGTFFGFPAMSEGMRVAITRARYKYYMEGPGVRGGI